MICQIKLILIDIGGALALGGASMEKMELYVWKKGASNRLTYCSIFVNLFKIRLIAN